MLTKKPTAKQLEYMDWEFGIFLHFGLRTFYEGWKDWDPRPMDPSRFNPVQLDCGQWARTAAAAGARYMVLTAKHHDGFANWPSAFTEFSVSASPWKNGKGDIIAEYTDACRKHGLKTGLYYSPADASMTSYSNDAAYDEYFINQISEILKPYGTIDILWFDGCGSEDHEYDWERIIPEIRRMQPEVKIFHLGDPDFRWIGNESGIAPVDHRSMTDHSDKIGREGEQYFFPAECDCMIRDRNWFYQEYDRDTVKTVDELTGLYYHSVGNGANLLLNIGPDRRGLLPEGDTEALLGMRRELDRRFSNKIASRADFTETSAGVWTMERDTYFLFDHVILQEDLTEGEMIESFEIKIKTGVHAIPVLIHRGGPIGHKRIIRLPALRAKGVTITLGSERGTPCLRNAELYYAGGA